MLQGPSPEHLLGTDNLGRDLLSRIVYGSRIALAVALPAVALALAFGTAIGLVSGYVGGRVDDVVVMLLDSIKAFPAVMLALVILALLGPSLFNVILVIGLTWSPNYARIVRAQVMSAKQNIYVEAGRSLGASVWRILSVHVLPNTIAPLLIVAAMDMPAVITFEAGLSFLGLGVRPPTPSWGIILSDGFVSVRQSPWAILWVGLALLLVTIGFTLFGEALRDVLDPRLAAGRKM